MYKIFILVLTIGCGVAIVITIFQSIYKISKHKKIIKNYMNTDYYKSTRYPSKVVVRDKGLFGEYSLNVMCNELKCYHRMLFNLYIPQENGNFQEIYAVLILPNRCVVVLEAKNRAGDFTGEDDRYILSKNWIQNIGNQTNILYNPILQNEMHINALGAYMCDEKIGRTMLMNAVVFVNNDAYFDFSNDDFSDLMLASTFVVNKNVFNQEVLEKLDALVKFQGSDEQWVDTVYDYLFETTQYTEEQRQEMMSVREGNAAKGIYKKLPEPIYLRHDEESEYIYKYDGMYVHRMDKDGGYLQDFTTVIQKDGDKTWMLYTQDAMSIMLKKMTKKEILKFLKKI